MTQHPVSTRILTGALTFVGLGAVWIAIAGNLPSEQELSGKESQSVTTTARAPEAVLDLSIPGVSSKPAASEHSSSSVVSEAPSSSMPLDHRAVQVAKLRCEAEVEQLCPESSDGFGRRQCLEKRAPQLSAPCQRQMRDRLVRWKEEWGQFKLACQADIRRFCPDVRLGGGQTLQCLQRHVQEISDVCYGMLPKGTLRFKQ
ncbi:MAG TPA: cysteine rich repeat-containing protein [Nitrospira sp.]|nr:cysteine rich repeat-containing protein [Nitrospira sp.]